MLLRLALVCLLLIPAAMTAGCGPVLRDVTADARYAKYTPAGSYILVTPARLLREKSDRFGTGTPYYLSKTGSESGTKLPAGDQLLATLPAGTHLNLEKILACRVSPRPPRSWDVVRPLARILDGPYAGTLVDLTEISHHKLVRELNADVAVSAASQLRRANAASRPGARRSATITGESLAHHPGLERSVLSAEFQPGFQR